MGVTQHDLEEGAAISLPKPGVHRRDRGYKGLGRRPVNPPMLLWSGNEETLHETSAKNARQGYGQGSFTGDFCWEKSIVVAVRSQRCHIRPQDEINVG